jgi:cytochrome P450
MITTILSAILSIIVVYFSYKFIQHLIAVSKVSHIPGTVQLFPFSPFRIPILAPYSYHGNHNEIYKVMQQKQGKRRIIKSVQGSRINVMITGHEDLKQVLLKNVDIMKKPKVIYHGLDLLGENILSIIDQGVWKQHHALCSPVFSTSHLSYMADISVDSMDLLIQRWNKKLEQEKKNSIVINGEHDMTDVTLDIIGKAGFGTDLNIWTEKTWYDRNKYTYSFREALDKTVMKGILVRGQLPDWTQFVFPDVNRAIADVDKYMDELMENYKSRDNSAERFI